MFDFADPTKEKDLSNKRTIELANNKIHIEKRDPYGFWFITFDRGQAPAHMRGSYTSPILAEAAVKLYLQQKDKAPVAA